MQNNLTILHQQFQQKHSQLSKITDKIEAFMQVYRNKSNVNQTHLKQKIKALKDETTDLKQEFKILQTDLITYGQLPHQFIRMIVELPKIYETFWENREEQILRKLYEKQQQCKLFSKKLEFMQRQNLQLKQKLQESQMKNCSIVIKQCDNSLHEDFLKAQKISPKLQKTQQELDSYIQNMEITIRESQDHLFKRITEQVSQEEQDSFEQNNRHSLEINTARPLYFHDISQQLNVEPNRKKSQPHNIFPQRNRESSKGKRKTYELEEVSGKSNFWTKFIKHIDNNRSKQSKSKVKKSLSQSKQNIKGVDNKQMNKLSTAQKKVLTSKISDFRRMLFLEKGIQRIGFKIENFD